MEVTYKVGEKTPSISGEAVDGFTKDLLRLQEGNFEEVTLDFAGTKHIGSLGIGSIFATHNKLSSETRTLKLINVPERIYRVFSIANLTDHLNIEKA